MWYSLCFTALAACSMTQEKEAPAAQAKELGQVAWQRQLEPALEASAKDGKPVLLLFQEVPG